MQRLDQLRKLPLDSVKMEPCYTKVTLLPERLLDLQSRFRFPHVDLVVQRTQNYMQEVGAEGSPGRMRLRQERREGGGYDGMLWAWPGRSSAQGSEARGRLTEDTHCTSSRLLLAAENKYLGK